MKRQRFCSDACRRAADSHVVSSAKLTCEWCGERFPKRRRSRESDANRFCSKKCCGASRTANRKEEWIHWWFRDCPVCGERFVTTRQNQRLCGKSTCAVLDARKRSSIGYTHKCAGERVCSECGDKYTVGAGGKRRLFCSDRCSRASCNRTRRARERCGSTGHETPRFIEIWLRDHGTCQICGLPIDRKVKCPNAFGVTLDHRWPLSQHGDHSEDNLQLAHFFCNVAKGRLLFLSDEWKEDVRKALLNKDWSFVSRIRREERHAEGGARI